jgi:hypothetical protein
LDERRIIAVDGDGWRGRGGRFCVTDSGREECIGPLWATNQTNKTPGRNRGLFISEAALLLWAALSGLLVRLLVLLIRLLLTAAALLSTLSGLLVLTALILIVLGHKCLPLFCEVWVE